MNSSIKERKWFIYLFILNFFDLFFTYVGLKMKYLEEMNPIMNLFYKNNEFFFIFFKLFFISIFIFILYYSYNKIYWTKYFIAFFNVLYSMLFIYHIYIIFIFLNL